MNNIAGDDREVRSQARIIHKRANRSKVSQQAKVTIRSQAKGGVQGQAESVTGNQNKHRISIHRNKNHKLAEGQPATTHHYSFP